MKQKYTLRSFLCLAGSSLLAVTSASAETYYWDSNNDTPGFGTAAGTWTAPTLGTTTAGWSTDSTGAPAIDGNSVTTTTADDLFFGTAATSLSGTITIDGTVNANSIFNTSVNLSGTNPTINFSAEGTYTRASNNGAFTVGTTFTGLGTSLTWKSQRNLNVSNVAHSAGKVILSTSPTSTFPYPGRTVMNSSANLGAPGTPLVFDVGTLRMANGFPYDTLSAMNAEHPVSFTLDKDAGFEHLNGSISSFTIDMPINLGTGTFWPESSATNTIILTQPNSWSQINLTSAVVEVSALEQLGPVGSTIQFGSGTMELSSGTLRITGTTLSDFDNRNFQTTDTKSVLFEIVEAAHTFTLDRVLDMGVGGLFKSGNGTLVLTEANTYTGTTTASGGTLVINGDQTLATGNVTVEANGTFGGSGTIGGNTTIANGGKLTFDISTEAGSHDKLELASGKTLTFSGASTLTITSSGGTPAAGLYTLVTALGGTTNISGSVPTVILPAGWVADAPEIIVDGSDTSLVINITSVEGLSGYAAWKDANAGGQGSEEDFDNDGVKNGVEYFMNVPAGFTANPALDGTSTITWPNGGNIPASDYGTQFVIQTSPDLATWTDVLVGDLTTNTDGPAGSLTYTLTGAAPRFVRLKVTPN